MLNLAWGGFANGSAALKAVCVQADGGIPGDLLEPTTAAAWAGWRGATAARTGVWLSLDHSDIIAPGFRDIPNQQAAWDRYQRQGSPIASYPGSSNHGWGRALDVTGYENSAAVWQAMNDLAPQFGLSHVTGAASGERWHWECTNAPTTVASASAATPILINTIPLESDMNIIRAENGSIALVGESYFGEFGGNDPDGINAAVAAFGPVRGVSNGEYVTTKDRANGRRAALLADIAKAVKG